MFRFAVLTALLAAVVALPTAPAANNPGVTRSGKCSNGATWKLKAKHDDGRLEVEFEVDQNIAGRSWSVTIAKNGAVVARAARTTRAPSGSFSVNRRLADSAGSDRIVATARAARGGSCRGVVAI
jgi:hypothetical protein